MRESLKRFRKWFFSKPKPRMSFHGPWTVKEEDRMREQHEAWKKFMAGDHSMADKL